MLLVSHLSRSQGGTLGISDHKHCYIFPSGEDRSRLRLPLKTQEHLYWWQVRDGRIWCLGRGSRGWASTPRCRVIRQVTTAAPAHRGEGFSNFLPHEHRGCFWDMSVVLSCSESPVGEMVAGSWMGPSGCTRPSGHRHSWLCARASAGDVTDAGAGLMQSSLGRWGARAPSESGGATPCRHVQTWTCSCQTQEVEAIWFPLKYLNFM